MNVLHVASEVAPLAKTGGLADVAGALPRALAGLGLSVTVVAPRYASIDNERWALARRLRKLSVPLGNGLVEVGLYEGRLPGSAVPVYLIDHEPSFARAGLYGEGGVDYPDNARRFALASRAALEVAAALGRLPDLVHAHDWQAALALHYSRRGALAGAPRAATVLTIHNLAFQGLFPQTVVDELGLGWDAFTPEGIEFFGQVSLLKAGIVAADRVVTVSPRYAREIQTPELGCGFDGLLRARADRLVGILNGVDYETWDPARDGRIEKRYSAADPSGKAVCKRALQQRLGLPARADVPLVGAVSRLSEQKGWDLVASAAEELARLELQLCVLGTGEPALEQALTRLAARHPSRFAVRIAYDELLAHQIQAGADLYLMPSRFEPCGLSQMYALRYGTVPVVRAVGGLDDTVVDWDPHTRTGTGFKFDEYTPAALVHAVRRGLGAWRDRAAWRDLMARAMRQDFSWRASARQYADLYEQVVRDRRQGDGHGP